MPYCLKYHPTPDPITVEISARCFQRRFLLRPDEPTNDRLRGILAYATTKHPEIDLHLITFQSNHYHALLTAPDPHALLAFVSLIQSRIGYEMNRIRGRTGDFWHRPFTGIIVRPSQLEARLRYLLAQGIEHGLYLKPEHNPCVHSLGVLTKGEPMVGGWLNRTLYHNTGQGRRIAIRPQRLVVRFAPPPGWETLTVPQQQARWRALVRDATAEATEKREEKGVTRILGADGMRATDPFSRPRTPGGESKPPEIFGDPEERIHFKKARSAGLAQRRNALERLADEWPACDFPAEMYPPVALRPILRRRE